MTSININGTDYRLIHHHDLDFIRVENFYYEFEKMIAADPEQLSKQLAAMLDITEQEASTVVNVPHRWYRSGSDSVTFLIDRQ